MNPGMRDFVGWDVATWSRPLRFWENRIGTNMNLSGKQGLELGANLGGLSLFFAHRFGCPMVCSDYVFPEQARAWHQAFAGPVPIEYKQVDVRQIPFPEASFDFVVFKSLLGFVGSHGRAEQIGTAMKEIHRVLRPGGVLFFAENLEGSPLHTLARRSFVPWGRHWHYLSLPEIQQLLRCFSTSEVCATGFFAAFVPRPEWLRGMVARFDQSLPFIPPKWRYVAYGYAAK